MYQLDFGGRVTQESAKNFQIEFRGKQVRENISFRSLDSVENMQISFVFRPVEMGKCLN